MGRWIEEFDGLGMYLFGIKSQNYRRLSKKGIYILFADQIIFNEKSNLIVGRANSGKTILSKMISKNKKIKRISEDSTINFLENKKLYTIKTKFNIKIDLKDLFKKRRYEVTRIIYLQEKDESSRRKELAFNIMLNFPFSKTDKLIENDSLFKIYSKLSFEFIPYEKDLNKKFEKLEKILEN